MNPNGNKKPLDELVSKTIAGKILEFDFKKWKEQHQMDIHKFKTNPRNHKAPSQTPINTWRIIMKSKITKLAAAAVIIIVIVTAISHLGVSIDGTSIAFGDMVEAMQEKPWVHWQVTSGTTDESLIESWFCFERSLSAHKRADGTLLFNDDREKNQHTYDPQKGVIYFAYGQQETHEPDSLPVASFQLVPIIMQYLAEEALKITRKTIWQDGQELETISAQMIKGSTAKQIELVRDVQQNLLISMKVDYKDDSKNLFAEFDYPQEGPESIYDLDAPQEAEVVSLVAPSDISQLIEKLDTLRQTSLTNYVALSVPADINQLPTSFTDYRPQRYFSVKDELVCSIWRKDKERRRSQGYFSKEANDALSLGDLSADVQNFAQLLVPVCTNIYSKKRVYHWQMLNGKSVRSIRRGLIEVYGRETFIEQICWPQIVTPQHEAVDWNIESVTGEDNELLIMIERRSESGFTGRWFLNPARNYICQLYEHSGDFPINQMKILEYAKTTNGQWYPRKILNTRYGRFKKDGEELPKTASRIIHLLENPVFPKGLFDPANLPEADE